MISDDIGPAVVGFFRPVIVLPAWAMQESDDRRRLLIAHERQHLSAGDQRVLALAYFIAVALPWNVVVWWMIVRLRHAIEIDCDARVILEQQSVRAYGELLIDVSRRPARRALGLTGFTESPSNLERRLMALTTQMPRRRKHTVAVLAATLGLATFIACEVPRPAGPASPGSSAMRSIARGATEVAAPLPKGAVPAIERVLERSFPSLAASGTESGRPLWLIADRKGNVVSSWIGSSYSDQELRRVAMQPAYDSMHLGVFNASMTSRHGGPINIVWAVDRTPWETHEYLSERMPGMILDSLRALQPALYSTLPAGQAVYFHLDGQAHRVGRIWAGPALSNAKEQWDYAQAQFPERGVLIATNLDVTTDDGRHIPVVNLYRLPWSMRYGSR